VKKTAADAVQFNTASDEAYLKKLYVPVLRRAGDFRAAVALIGHAPLLIHNAGEAFKPGVETRREKLGEDEIVAWLTK